MPKAFPANNDDLSIEDDEDDEEEGDEKGG